MSIFNKIHKFLVKEDKKLLGRWSIEHCDKKINYKIDLSNEDHCGPCGQYRLHRLTDIYNEKKRKGEIL